MIKSNRQRTDRAQLQLRRAAAPLPVPVTPRGLPELREEAARFDVELAHLARALNGGSGFEGNPSNHVMKEGDVELVRRIALDLDLYRSRWRTLNQPATDDAIVSEMLTLTTTMPMAGNLNPNLLSETLCEHMAELKPSLFAVFRGCREVRIKHQFLNTSDLVTEVKGAQRRAKRFSGALEHFNLAEFEADYREQVKRYEVRSRDCKADRKREKLNHLWMFKSKHELVPGGLDVEDERDYDGTSGE